MFDEGLKKEAIKKQFLLIQANFASVISVN